MSDKLGSRKFAFVRIAFVVSGLAISGVLTWLFASRLDNKADTLVIIATIFSILAAALFAVISILGDPSMLIDSSWRKNTLTARETQRKLHRKSDIFLVYLVTLGLLVVFALTRSDEPLYPWIQRATFFFSVFGFWESLSLPHSLKDIQRKRLNDAIEAKKPGS